MTDTLPPRSKNTDPISSHQAEAAVMASGSLSRHMAAVLELVRRHPRRTSTELCELAAGHPAFSTKAHERLYQIRRRLSDLRIRDKIERIKLSGECAWEVKEPKGTQREIRFDG